MGVYTIKEVSAPRYYVLNDRTLLAEIRHNGDIVRFEVLNSSISLNLTIQKKGPSGAMPGQTIQYDIYEVQNGSSGRLENFYIHDRIPTDATRALKIVTGTYSERMYYKITYKTNYRDYRVLADNLLTKNSYEYSLHPNVLGLANGEYVTDVRLEFPKASPGFKMIKNMSVFCQVMPNMPKDYRITNRADVGGILLVMMATGSLYMFSVPRGYTDGFITWCKQVAALCLTAFLQTIVLVAGLVTYNTNMLLGIGLMLSSTEVPRIAQNFGLDTSMRFNVMSTVYSVNSVVNMARNVGRIAGR